MTNTDSEVQPGTPNPRWRRRYTLRSRQRLIEQFENSEQSVAQFCEEHGLCRSSLWRWLARRRGDKPSAGALVQIPMQALQSAAASMAAVRMELGCGQRLEIVVSTDPDWLAALVRALAPGIA